MSDEIGNGDELLSAVECLRNAEELVEGGDIEDAVGEVSGPW